MAPIWSELSTELGVPSPYFHSTLMCLSPSLIFMMWIEISCLMACIPLCMPHEGKDGICFHCYYFIACWIQFRICNTNYKSQLPLYLHFPPHSPPLFLDVVTETFFQFWFAKFFLPQFLCLHCSLCWEPPLQPWIFPVPFHPSVLRNVISSKRSS